MIALRDGGADVLVRVNPLSTRMMWRQPRPRLQHPRLRHQSEDNESYYSHIMAAVDHKPQFTMDDGADLVNVLHTKRKRSWAT